MLSKELVMTAREFLRQVRDFPHATLVLTIYDGFREFEYAIAFACDANFIVRAPLFFLRLWPFIGWSRNCWRTNAHSPTPKERHNAEFVIATPYNDGTDIIQMVRSNCRFHVTMRSFPRVREGRVLSELRELTLRT